MKPYRVEVIADHSGEWCGNGLSFDTLDEAKKYAMDLFSRWTAVRFWRVLGPCPNIADPDLGELHFQNPGACSLCLGKSWVPVASNKEA